MPQKIGFIGLGNMGSRIARRILDAGHELIVNDVNKSAIEALHRQGAKAVATPAEVASKASLVFCSLPTPAIVEAVALGKDGLIDSTWAKTIVDLSTTGPTVSKRIATALAERDIALLDAPVSGGIVAAEKGTLTVMLSGAKVAFDLAEPVLKAIGNNIFYVGEQPGLGQTIKLLNNMLVAANAVASFEVMVMGVKAGLSAKTILDIVNVSSGRSFATTDKIPQCVTPRTFPLRFATELLYKDVKLGTQEAENLGSPLWMIHAAQSFLAFAMSQGDGPLDYASTIKHFEQWADVEVSDKA